MEFKDIALDDKGNRRGDDIPGANFLSEDRRWRIVASDVTRPAQSEWQVWQHVDVASPISIARNWQRRLPWIRLPSSDAARVVVVALAALPANASWEVGRVVVRDALRSLGAAAFFRGMFAANMAVAGLAARLRQRAAADDPLNGESQDAGA